MRTEAKKSSYIKMLSNRWRQRKRFRSGASSSKRKRTRVAPRLRAFARPTSALSELGNWDTSTVSECSTTMSLTALNIIQEGDTKSSRHGNRIVMKSIEYKFYIYPGANQVIPQAYTAALIYDKQPNGAVPLQADLWTSATALAFKNLDWSHRFVFLKKIEGFMDIFTQQPPIKEVEGYLKVNLPTFYEASTGAASDISTGSLILMILGDQAISTGTHPLIRCSCRIRFQS